MLRYKNNCNLLIIFTVRHENNLSKYYNFSLKKYIIYILEIYKTFVQKIILDLKN